MWGGAEPYSSGLIITTASDSLDEAVEAYKLFDGGNGRTRWCTCGTKMRAFTRVPYRAMKPPSITSSVPVMNDASSDARKSTP